MALSPTLPNTRSILLPPKNSVSSAPDIAATGPVRARSICSSTSGGISAMTSSRETPPSRTAIALAPIAISTSSCSVLGRLSESSWTSTTETAAAVPSRSSSQRSLKLAIEGRKISTSAIITKSTVSTSSLIDRPRASGTVRAGASSAPFAGSWEILSLMPDDVLGRGARLPQPKSCSRRTTPRARGFRALSAK